MTESHWEVTILAVKFLAFWKLRPKSWGGPIHCWSPPPTWKLGGGPVSPSPHGCCAYAYLEATASISFCFAVANVLTSKLYLCTSPQLGCVCNSMCTSLRETADIFATSVRDLYHVTLNVLLGIYTIIVSGVGVRLKVGDKYWEDWRGCALPSWGSGGLPQKKNQFCAKNYAFWASFGTSFLYYSRKWGDYPPVLKVGDLSPCPPSAPTPMIIVLCRASKTIRQCGD